MTDKPKTTRKRRTKAEMEAARAAEAQGGKPPQTQEMPQSPGQEAGAIGGDALVEAIKWCNVAQSDDDNHRPLYETHSLVSNGWLLAFDGVISAGHTSPLQGFYSPNTARLLAALTKAGKGLTVVMDADRLKIAGKSFRANVPYVEGSQNAVPFPEQATQAATDAIAQAVEAVYPLTRAAGDTVLESSIMLTYYGSAIATNRQVFVEAYHGVTLPTNLIIPRRMATAMKGKTGIYGLGYSDNALTLWYGQEKYLRCQLHEPSTWPPVEQCLALFPDGGSYSEIPKALPEAVAAVEPHTTDGALYLSDGSVRSARTEDEADASYSVGANMPSDLVGHSAVNLAFMCKHGKTVNWYGPEQRCLFLGDFKGMPIRGTVSARNI